ncbi:MAG TPA: DNA polymerase [Pyrinomonadaceae bacterium]|jgi:DNA polymerase-1|nr:DNA polymerase [Pyrinomonadaceae bacterium]
MSISDYKLITTAEELRAAVGSLEAQSIVGFDTETTSLDPYNGKMRLVQLAIPGAPVYIFDLKKIDPGGFASPSPTKAEALKPLQELLAAPRPVKVAHNAKFDAKWAKHYLDIEMGGLFDTMLASQLVSAGDTEDRHSLQLVAERYLGETLDKASQLSDWSIDELTEAQLEYAARDAAIMLPLRNKLLESILADGLKKCAQLEFECIMPVAQIELTGIYLDQERWREQLAVVNTKRAALAEELQVMLAEESQQQSFFGPTRNDINLDSHVQLTKALKRRGIEVPDSTRNWKLQPLAAKHPEIAKLLEYRTMQKALTSYGENILKEIKKETGRIHANFHQIGAPTGRFACTNPNIQQVPHAIEYRRCFRADTRDRPRKLVIADYSQIELRILADFTGDQGFVDAFNSGADLHRVTAAQVFNVPLDQVTKEQRDFAKRLNFGVVYGIGAQRFSMMTGIPLTEAENILRRYFATYRQLDAWLRDAANRALRERTARTASGRVARFRFDPEDRQAASLAQRNGKNMPIQGTSADILKRALRLLHDKLRDTNAQIINIVHDEIVVEADAAQAAEIAEMVEDAMCAAGEEYVKKVPVKVETEVSDEWVK